MMLVTRDVAVGSALSSDPNAQSFHSWNRRSGNRQSGEKNPQTSDSAVLLDCHAAHHRQDDLSTSALNKAVSLSQTQDRFLQKVEEALKRMSELSSLAQDGKSQSKLSSNYTSEFAHLQEELRELGSRLELAGDVFKISEREASAPADIKVDELADRSLGQRIAENLQESFDPEATTILDPMSAVSAATKIRSALQSVSNLRGELHTRLDKLGQLIERFSAAETKAANPAEKISGINIADEQTHSICDNILREAATAMLAQANALPQSALRLLD